MVVRIDGHAGRPDHIEDREIALMMERCDRASSRRAQRGLHVRGARHDPLKHLLDRQSGSGPGEGGTTVADEMVDVQHEGSPSEPDGTEVPGMLSNAFPER
jgi:hypothetical protein